ncbi:MAG: response regulator transcription factor [Verrucomicrobia bacterium]|nr:response regulator transcription factor [Verrucomicrobiota bacterium]
MSEQSSSCAKKRILIVDDHALVRQGLRDFIEREKDISVCGETAGRAEALQLCAGKKPHLILIDLSLGSESGLDLVKDITVQFPEIKMLVLSMQDELLYAERVLRAGASGYVSKDVHPDRLIEAVRCVLGGGVYASEAVKQKIMQTVRRVDSSGDPVASLSDRELAVFEQVGKGLSTVDIAKAMNLSVKTVETYRARIKTKLGVGGSAELVQRAVQWLLDKK